MGDTVDALAYKADVPTRAKEWVGEKTHAVTSAVSDRTPDGQQVKRQMAGMKRSAERNPIGLAVGGAAVGFLAGMLLPSTRMEDERLGAAADELKATAADAGREALERGKDVAQEAGQAAVETAKERGREESAELSSTLQQKAGEAAGSETPSGEPTGASGRAV